MPQLDISTYPSQIFWLLITFLSLYLLVRYIVSPRMSKIMDARWERQDNNEQRSEELNNEAEQLLLKAEQLLLKAREEASALLHETESILKEEQEKTLENLQNDLNKKVQDVEERLRKSRLSYVTELPAIAESLAKDLMIVFQLPSSEKTKGGTHVC